jgi:hypothetical protein
MNKLNVSFIVIAAFLFSIAGKAYSVTGCGLISAVAQDKLVKDLGNPAGASIAMIDKSIKQLEEIIKVGKTQNDKYKYTKDERLACKVQLEETKEFRKMKLNEN